MKGLTHRHPATDCSDPSSPIIFNGIRILSNQPKNPFSVVQTLLLFFDIAQAHLLLVTCHWSSTAGHHQQQNMDFIMKSCLAPWSIIHPASWIAVIPAALPREQLVRMQEVLSSSMFEL